jgi:membrane protease YdiL (CAAX protease family)
MWRETAWFVGVTLLLAWAFGFAWAFHVPVVSEQHRWWLIFAAMCSPGVVGLGCAWLFHREPPRAMGFEFTGALPWVVALLYPLAFEAVAIPLAYAVRAVTGNASFIHYTPEHVGWQLFGHVERGAGTIPLALAETIISLAPWLAIALVYRVKLPDRLGKLAPLARIVVWVAALGFWPGPKAAPNALGEEVGWRGFAVRRWASRPLVAAAVTMPVWALFHLPVIFGEHQRGHLAQNLTLLASIAVAAVPFAALYLWSKSIWPCAVFHFAWNNLNPLVLGDVYRGGGGLFGGANWIFNGEGLFGVIINGAVAVYILRRWWREERTSQRDAGSTSPPARQTALSS